jgi:hypothetical protein
MAEDSTTNDFDALQIEDGIADYSKKSEFNKPKQVENIMNKALQARGNSMHPEYINTSVSNDGSIKKETVPDSREAYCNAVEAVVINLAPELTENIKYKTKIEELEKEKEQVFKKYAYIDFEPFADYKDGKWYLKPMGEPFIPEYDSVVRINKVMPSSKFYLDTMGKVESAKGYRNQYNRLYWSAMIKISDKILSELQCLIHSLNYFKQATSF